MVDTLELKGEKDVTWTLTPASFAATKEKVDKINVRATKRGFTGRIEITGSERIVKGSGQRGIVTGEPLEYLVIDVTITGQAPSYSGWEFLAAVDAITTEAGTDFILRTAPGVDESRIDRATLAPGRCAHCNSDRNRIYTFLVRNTETGEACQVGKTCMKDFTGWAGTPVFLSEDDIISELSDFIGGSGSGTAEYTPETVVAIAWAASRRYGWAPRSSGGIATAETVGNYLYGNLKVDEALRSDLASALPAAYEKAREIIPALLHGLDGAGDYATNLKTALRGLSVSTKHFGIVVSAVSAYERMIDAQIRKTVEAKKKAESSYAGTINEKITVTGTATRVRATASSWGYHESTSMLLIIEDGTTILKTFTKAAWAYDINEGDAMTVTATVKGHEEYNGSKQTVVKRPKLIDLKKAEEA